MKRLTKIVAKVLAISTVFASMSSIYVNADEFNNDTIVFDNSINTSVDENIVLDGLSTMPPINNTSDGIDTYNSWPPYSTWNLATQGYYYFSGTATSSTLYTNYNFTGVSDFSVTVNNKGSNSVTVKICRAYEDYGIVQYTFVVPAKGSKTLNYRVSSSQKYFLSFSAPCNITGGIQ